jgi:hypothetical protein
MQHKFTLALDAWSARLRPIDPQNEASLGRVNAPQLVDRPAFEGLDKERGLSGLESGYGGQPLGAWMR